MWKDSISYKGDAWLRRILLVRNDNIGDVICTTPCFYAVKKHYPHVTLAVLVNRLAEEVVRGNPWVDEVYVYDKAKHRRYRNKLLSWWHQALVLNRIRRSKFDVAVGVRSTFSPSQGWLVFASGAPIRIGPGPPRRKYLRAYYNYYVPNIRQDSHEVDRALGLLTPLGAYLAPHEKKLHLPVPQEARVEVAETRKRWGLVPSKPVVAINFNTRLEENRWWAIDKYIALIRRLQSDGDVQVVLTCGPGDEKTAKLIQADLQAPPWLYCSPSLIRFAAFVEDCDVFVSLEGGPIHVSAAVGTPTVAIFGKTNPSVWRPWGEHHRVVRNEDHANLVNPMDVYQELRALLRTILSRDTG